MRDTKKVWLYKDGHYIPWLYSSIKAGDVFITEDIPNTAWRAKSDMYWLVDDYLGNEATIVTERTTAPEPLPESIIKSWSLNPTGE